MFDENDYLTSNILNDIECRVANLYNSYSSILENQYVPKTWSNNELVFIDDIKHIEDGIDYIGSCLEYPEGFIRGKEWNTQSDCNISYKDLNRWMRNIEYLENSIGGV